MFSIEVAVIWWFLFFMGFGVFPIVLDWNTPLYNVLFGLSVATLIVSLVWSVLIIRNQAKKGADSGH